MKQLEDLLDLYLVKKAPALPKNAKESIVKIAPWVTVIIMILLLPVILGALGLAAVFAPFGFIGGVQMGVLGVVSLVLSIASLVLEAMAIPGLFNKTAQGWRYVYYSTLLTAVDSLIHFNLAGLIIGSLLSLYILFQVKEYYR